jgi:acetolactate decarboxylase
MLHFARLVRAAFLAAVLVVVAATASFAAALYQVGTMESLAAGDYAGRESFADLARHGDLGLGTFTDLNGEMIALDGRFYQVTSDGAVHSVRPNALTPFAQVIFFTGGLDCGRVDGLSLEALGKALTAKLPDPTRFYLVRVDGLFDTLTLRSPRAQAKPWPPLAQALKTQSVFPLQGVAGTLIGVYSPQGASALSATGWHFHFLSADRRHGGHVLATRIAAAKARGDQVTNMRVVFPAGPTPRGDFARPAAGTE